MVINLGLKSSKVLSIIFVHILLVLVNWIVAFFIYEAIKDDAKTINEMGQIRGGIQLVTKRYLADIDLDKDVHKIDKLIESMRNHDCVLSYYDLEIDELQTDWEKTKNLLECKTSKCRDEVLLQSEYLWTQSNNLVLQLQKNNEEELNNFNYLFMLLVIDLLFITIIVYLVYTLINPKLEKKSKELEQYIDVIDENIITSSTDLKGIITHASHAFSKISGYSKDELIGKNHNIIRHPDMDKKVFKELWETLKEHKVWKGEIKNQKKNGEEYWVYATISEKVDDNGIPIGYTAIRQNITDKKIVEKLSLTDPMTDLYNRRKFNEVLEDELYRTHRHNMDLKENAKSLNLYLLIIDVDYFKQYNDKYGHDKGDIALTNVAKVFQNHANRHADWAFRLGGEEFAMFITSPDNTEKLMQYANKIRESVENLAINHEKSKVSNYLTVSIGVSVANDLYGYDKDVIYKNSDIALYRAKQNGRNSCEIF